MKQKLMLKRLIIYVTAFFFTAYAAYNIFVLIRDRAALPFEGKFISITIAAIFVVLAVFMLTTDVKNLPFRTARKIVFILTMLLLVFFKLRMSTQVIDFLETSPTLLTVVYGGAYFMTVAALMLLILYYVFFRNHILFHFKNSVVPPTVAMILFLGSLTLEMILLIFYGIGLEASFLRTIVIRPVFYLGFVGLCAYFLLFPQIKMQPMRRRSVNSSHSTSSTDK